MQRDRDLCYYATVNDTCTVSSEESKGEGRGVFVDTGASFSNSAVMHTCVDSALKVSCWRRTSAREETQRSEDIVDTQIMKCLNTLVAWCCREWCYDAMNKTYAAAESSQRIVLETRLREYKMEQSRSKVSDSVERGLQNMTWHQQPSVVGSQWVGDVELGLATNSQLQSSVLQQH